jgi:hypothetical protein
MKKAAIFFVLFTWGWCFAQENEIPDNIKEALYKYFPNAQDIDWEIQKGKYEAEFTGGGYERSVLFDGRGKVLETKTQISVIDLPVPAVQYIVRNYKDSEITKASRIIDFSGNTTFDIEIGGKDFLFNAYGKFLQIVK